MDNDEHLARRAAEFEALQSLKSASSIFDFECDGSPPDRYTLLFHGQGLSRNKDLYTIEVVDIHRIEVWLHFSYPESPPDIRWLTPIFHPNISYSGLVHLREIGLTWERAIGLDFIAERLWDMARLAYCNLENPSNFAARKWLNEQTEYAVPVDPRPLRDVRLTAASNIIRYMRSGGPPSVQPPQREVDVFYIGEDTPTPELPARSVSARRRSAGDEDVLYIGDE